jgi:DNA end-binding protein Ku
MANMRAIWRGSISLGLVGVPVKLYTATEEKNLRFHQVHAADGGRIQMHRLCSADGEEVPYAEIGKGLEVDGEMVILTDEDFEEVPVPTAKTVTVLEFVPTEQVDPILFDKAYYVAPDGPAALKPYLLIKEALARADRVGIAKIALRQREHLAAVRVRDDVIVLSMMLWPDEVREPDFDFVEKEAKVRPQERQMAQELVESMAGDFDPAEHTDEYREAVQELVEAKLAGKTLEKKAERPTKSADLLAALTASVDAARQGKGRPAAKKAAPAKRTTAAERSREAPGVRSAKAAARRAPAKSAPAKKTAVKKTAVQTAAKKTTAKKAAAKKAAPAKKTTRKKAA